MTNDIKRDKNLFAIKGKNPQSIYKNIRRARAKNSSNLKRLVVEDKVYEEATVPDGFFDSIEMLKSQDYLAFENDDYMLNYLSDYKYLLKLQRGKSMEIFSKKI